MKKLRCNTWIWKFKYFSRENTVSQCIFKAYKFNYFLGLKRTQYNEKCDGQFLYGYSVVDKYFLSFYIRLFYEMIKQKWIPNLRSVFELVWYKVYLFLPIISPLFCWLSFCVLLSILYSFVQYVQQFFSIYYGSEFCFTLNGFFFNTNFL